MSCFTRILHLFRCLFKQQLHNISCMCALLLFPIILFLFQAASVRTDSDRITVLLFASQPDATVSELFETLTEWEQTVSGGVLSFQIADDAESAKEQVLTGKAECAYLFPDDFGTLLQQNDWKHSVTLCQSPSSYLAPLTREVVCSAIFSQNPLLTADSFFRTTTRYAKDAEQILADLPAIFRSLHASETARFHVNFLTVSEKKTAPVSSDAALLPIRGLCSVFLFLLGLFGAATWCQDVRKKFYVVFPKPVRLASCPLQILAFLLPAALSVYLALLFCGQMTVKPSALFTEFLLLMGYVLLLTLFCSLYAGLVRHEAAVYPLVPLLGITSLFLCPVFFDAAVLVPAVSTIRNFLPPYWFLFLSQ